jgi:hypothetical protein
MSEHPLSLQVERRIYLIRGEKVMLDYDLALLYGVETRAPKQAVRRNGDRFPADFMFELTRDEIDILVSQTVIRGRGKFGGAAPMAFTEQGVAMLSSVLRSKTRRAGQHRHHANLRPAARAASLQHRPGPQARSPRAEI